MPLGRDAERLVAGGNTYVVRLRSGRTLASLAATDGVISVEPDRVRERRESNDPRAREQTHLAQIGWTPPTGSRRPLVAILDTGADASHPDLVGQVLVGRARAFVGKNALEDKSGHGTHLAGIVAATTNNATGVAGVSNARLLIVAIADARGRTTTSSMVRGIDYAIAQGAKVINISFGGEGFSKVERDAILRARRAGVLVVVAVGNGGRVGSPKEYPGAYPHVLAVAATRPDGKVILDSTQGEQVTMAAPGKRILSTNPRGRYGPRTGTSMSAAVVTGAAARILSQRRVDASQLRELLVGSARDVGAPGRDNETGWGIVDLGSALTTPTPTKDGVEPNDDPALARQLPPLLEAGSAAEATAAGSLERWADAKDGYRVALNAGDTVTVTAESFREGLDVDIAIWRPGAPEFVPGPAYTRDWLVASGIAQGPTETVTHVAGETGDYTVEARTSTGRGRYVVRVQRSRAS